MGAVRNREWLEKAGQELAAESCFVHTPWKATKSVVGESEIEPGE
jgi:hypothetical protein